jgi:NTE family protein
VSEIEEELANADWEAMMHPDLPYSSKAFRRKEDDLDRPVQLELGLRKGLRLQSGLHSGHRLGLLLSRISMPYSAVDRFDDLPVPFRAIATDLVAGEIVVLDRGPLGTALRASMALPGTFDPVIRDGRRLADGGILNNLPTEEARAMGVDVVIAVSVNAPRRVEPAETVQGVATRAIRLMMQSLDQPRFSQADVVVLPDVVGIRASDFERIREIAERGYIAASREAEALLPYALDSEGWERYQRDRRLRIRPRNGLLSFVDVTGVRKRASAQVSQRIDRNLDPSADPDAIEEDLDRIVGEGRYGSAMYRRLARNDAEGLGVDFQEKSYAPPMVRLAVNAGVGTRDTGLSLASRITWLDASGLGSEWRLDVSIGSRIAFAGELLQPVRRGERSGGVFLAPRAYYSRAAEAFYRDEVLVTELTRQRGGGSLDGLWLAGRRTEIRLGYGIARVSDVSRVGSPIFAAEGAEKETHVQIRYEGQDRAYLPTRGLRFASKATWWTKAPGSDDSFGTAEGRLDLAHPLASRHVIALHLEGAAGFGSRAPVLYQPGVGGLSRLGALPPNAIRDRALLIVGLGHRIALARLPRLFGGKIYGTSVFEVGSAFDRVAEAKFKISGTAGLSADTLLGPLFVGASVGSGGSWRAYFLIGASVR